MEEANDGQTVAQKTKKRVLKKLSTPKKSDNALKRKRKAIRIVTNDNEYEEENQKSRKQYLLKRSADNAKKKKKDNDEMGSKPVLTIQKQQPYRSIEFKRKTEEPISNEDDLKGFLSDIEAYERNHVENEETPE